MYFQFIFNATLIKRDGSRPVLSEILKDAFSPHLRFIFGFFGAFNPLQGNVTDHQQRFCFLVNDLKDFHLSVLYIILICSDGMMRLHSVKV